MKLYDTNKLFGFTKEYFIVSKDKYMHISQVLVNPKYIGMNICKKMLKKIINLDLSIKYALRVDTDNIIALKCYKKVGFNIIGQLNNTNYMIL